MPWTPPPLKTEHLYLVGPDDAVQPAFAWNGRDAAAQALPGLPSNWKIHLAESDQPIGTIGYIRWEREARSAEVGFILMNIYTGRGYMTEACRAVVGFGFEGMGLDRVEAKSLPNNLASIRVLEKVGMTCEGRFQGRLSSKGPLVDLDLFSIKKAAWQSAQGSR
ncbi:MAG: GNAT family N-acetyltransferase [Nitrospirae bacterium]|nr:GNAT family N-acetyltransferase [Candidatus Manganitrophaceae bacterium]